MSHRIPAVDLQWQHREVASELVPQLLQVMERGQFVLGAAGEEFERRLAAFVGCKYAVGVSNGTDALELALRAARLPDGASVIVPAYTFIATVTAVIRAGLTPILVDVAEPHLLLDVEAVERAITPTVKAIVAVHLFGQMAPMRELKALADGHGLVVIEDAAQAHGAVQDGDAVACRALAASTSFYPAKNLGAYGDAGAVLTNSSEVAASVRSLRDHGSVTKYRHAVMGSNARLDEIQATVLSVKLDRLAHWNAMRQEAAERYAERLMGMSGVTLPSAAQGNAHTWHLYVVRVRCRDRALFRLRREGVEVAVHYPVPPHLQEALSFLGYRRGAFPTTEAAADEVLTLPLFPGITMAQQEHVAEHLARTLGK